MEGVTKGLIFGILSSLAIWVGVVIKVPPRVVSVAEASEEADSVAASEEVASEEAVPQEDGKRIGN